MTEPQGLRRAIAEAQRYLAELKSPPNEANTCDWVVRPLLVALGYPNHEIFAQAGDVSNKFPDYTILPGTDHTWYLEAKAWSVGLDSSHVDQAINYAHSNGQRWVVLSNGREWRLYDDNIKGKSADRLVATAMLEDTDTMARFLSAIARDSIVNQRVADYASERRVREYLATAIIEPKSPVIQAVLKAVKQNLGSVPITAESVVDILNARQSASADAPPALVEPQVLMAPLPVNNKTGKTYGPLFVKFKHLFAEGEYDPEGKFLVKRGARVAKTPVPSYAPVFERRTSRFVSAGDLIVREDHLELVRDVSFKTPSGASDFVIGASTNGWAVWTDEHGTPLDRLCPRSKEAKWRQGWSGSNSEKQDS